MCTAIESIGAGRAHTRPRDSSGLRSLPNRLAGPRNPVPATRFYSAASPGGVAISITTPPGALQSKVMTRLPPRLGY
jgi:hypothetical protein